MTRNNTFFYNGDAVEYTYESNISMSRKQMFVTSVCKNVVSDGNYRYLLRDILFDYFVVKYFSDIDMSEFDGNEVDANDFIDGIENFLDVTYVANVIKSGMDDGVLNQLNKAVDSNITYITGVNHNSVSDSLVSLIKMISDKIDSIDFNSISEFIPVIANSLENGEFTMDSLFSAYEKSDSFKKIMERADEESKNRQRIIENIVPTVENISKSKTIMRAKIADNAVADTKK